MARFAVLLLFLLSIGVAGQSRRVAPGGASSPTAVVETSLPDQSPKQMFDEANGYARNRFADFEQKKVAYSESLRVQTLREQKQLAAKYAGLVSQPNVTGDD